MESAFNSQLKVEIVSATRYSEEDFWEKSALGQSLGCLAFDERMITRIKYENKSSLPELYNKSINAPENHDILLFVHDDVWLHDYYFIDRIIDGLNLYDVVGLAGNIRRAEGQIAWFSKDDKMEPDFGFLSGVLGHSKTPFEGPPMRFGPVPAECELLDGVFLAAKKKTLVDHQVFFDPQFDFHFYDLDFCRTAREKNLRLGTCMVSATHQSSGNFASPAWKAKLSQYQKKWAV